MVRNRKKSNKNMERQFWCEQINSSKKYSMVPTPYPVNMVPTYLEKIPIFSYFVRIISSLGLVSFDVLGDL